MSVKRNHNKETKEEEIKVSRKNEMGQTRIGDSTHWVSFASSRASSSELNVLTQRTGPKTSSLHICIEGVTSVMMVGSMKNPFFRCCQCHPFFHKTCQVFFIGVQDMYYVWVSLYLRTIPTIHNFCSFTFSRWDELQYFLILKQMQWRLDKSSFDRELKNDT